MQFHEWITQYQIANLAGGRELKKTAASLNLSSLEYVYRLVLATERPGSLMDLQGRRTSEGDSNRARNSYIMEYAWIKANRPYYNIYPSVIKPLLRLDLSKVPVRCVELPLPQIVFRLPMHDNPMLIKAVGGPFAGKEIPLHSMLIASGIPNIDKKGKPKESLPKDRFLLVTAQFNMGVSDDPLGACIIPNTMRIPVGGEKSVSEELMSGDFSACDLAPESVENLYKLAIAVCFLSRDVNDNLIIPDVLSDDKQRYEDTHDARFVQRAIRRGKFGWNVGEALEGLEKHEKKAGSGEGHVSPHYRNPSPFALYWTGTQKSIPVFRYRRGTFVNEELIRKVPTGHLGQIREG